MYTAKGEHNNEKEKERNRLNIYAKPKINKLRIAANKYIISLMSKSFK